MTNRILHEDDTFRALSRIPFEEVVKLLYSERTAWWASRHAWKYHVENAIRGSGWNWNDLPVECRRTPM